MISDSLQHEIAEHFERILRPRVRNDGGDITLAAITGDTIHIEAHADCATCPATDVCLKNWLQTELSQAAKQPVRIEITKHAPYFTRMPRH